MWDTRLQCHRPTMPASWRVIRGAPGIEARDACLGAMNTRAKLGVSCGEYLGDRFGVAGTLHAQRRADLIVRRADA